MKYETIHTIKALRKHFHYTQTDLAFILGISSRCYRSKESGKSFFTQGEIIILAYLFEMDNEDIIDFFFTKENNKELYIKINMIKIMKNDYIKELITLKHEKFGKQVLKP